MVAKYALALAFMTMMGGTAAFAAPPASGSATGPVTYSSYDYHLGVNTHVTYDDETIYAGSGLVTLNTNIGPLGTFCVDVNDWLLGSGSYSDMTGIIDTNLTGISALDGRSKIADITSLLEHFFAGPQNSVNSAATQTAVWATEYATGRTTSNNKITGWSGITITPDDGSVTTQALADLNAISTPFMTLHELTPTAGAPANQSMVYVKFSNGTTRNAVPEPASFALLSMALLGLGCCVSRARKTA